MGFQAARPTSKAPSRPQRAPSKAALAPILAREAPAPVESHEFPDRYELVAPMEGAHALPAQLPSGLERLIELAGSRMGCPHEEILALKAAALSDPAMVSQLCQHIFDTRERPLREAHNPLDTHRSPGQCAFWVEGAQGKAIAVAAAIPALAPYDGQRLELYAPEHSPFKDAYDPAAFAVGLEARLARQRSRAPAGAPIASPAPAPASAAIAAETLVAPATSPADLAREPASTALLAPPSPEPTPDFDPDWGV